MASLRRLPSLPLLVLSIVTALPTASANAEGIVAVTVYPDRATIVREHPMTIAAGDGILTISALPARLDPASVRVRAEGLSGLRLHHVETRTVHGRDLAHPQERALDEALQVARAEHRTLGDGRRAQELRLGFIERLSQNAGAVEPVLSPDQWPDAWSRIGDGALEALQQITRIDAALHEVDREIGRIERELAALRTERRDSLEARIHYQVGAAGTARVTLEYQVPGAHWSPVYEARLDTVAGRLEWVQRAEVQQNTGEAWDDVVLHLATGRPALGGRWPELHSWFLDIAPPDQALKHGWADRMEDAPRAAMAPMAAAAMTEAALETTGFTSRYRVPGRISLPSDNRQQRFLLASREHDAVLSARVVPAFSTHAYLSAETVFEGDTPLLPGAVNLFQDGQTAGQTRIGTVAPGAPLRLAFGIDDRLEVRHELDRDSLGREGLLRRQQRLQRGYRITLTNHHDREVRVTVLDRLPVPRDERIQVELTATTTPPTARDVDDRLGVLSWTRAMAAGGTETLQFGYTVSWPQEVNTLQGLDRPGR